MEDSGREVAEESSSEVSEGLWTMGAVTRRTGIGEHTLRAWERRFGFPQPKRLPSGHRRYPADQVRRLVMIHQALSCGYRAGDVVPLPSERLEAVVAECVKAGAVVGPPTQEWVRSFLEGARQYDRSGLTARLHQAAATLGLRTFLSERIEAVLPEIGAAWARGELSIRHEHFASHVIEDALRSLRLPLEPCTSGRPIVLASLPDEPHALGLQVAALALVADGRSIRILGSGSPVDEIVHTAEEIDAAAVGLSISEYSVGEATSEAVGDLRRRLTPRTALWLGGAGAAQLSGLSETVQVVTTLDDLARVTAQLDLESPCSA